MKRSNLELLPLFLFVLFLVSCQDKKAKEKTKDLAEVQEEYTKKAPDWSKNAVIYEVNVRQYTEEGTFNAFREHLTRLEEMGVDILWFMPVHPIGEKNRKGTLGSYYSVKDYEAINPEFGTMEDFKALVDDAHSRGMKVLIDWVANHTAWDNVWVDEGHLDWYTLDSIGGLQPPLGTDWWDVADLNYENQEMRDRMISSMQFWLRDVDIDGFRCDVAEWVPDDFWDEARPQLDEVKPVFMLAEAEHPEHHEKAFDMSYAWEYHFIMNDLAQGKKDATHVGEYLTKDKRFPSEAYRLQMTSNHDENTWKGTVKERLGDGVQAMAVMAATIQGMPLIYSGQEAALDHRLEFFEKDEIDWTETPLQGFYTRLIDANHNNEALWNGAYGGETRIVTVGNDNRVIAYHREKNGDSILILLNMSGEERDVSLNGEGIEGFYEELFTGLETEITTQYSERLGPWNYRVYEIRN
ncbi:MAG: alpha-amylase [Flavobacteriales bacterium]|nr:alpha-amylase [Flavobacteriales bacterium]